MATSNPRVMIVGGNFVGKGAEAMMLTVRNAVADRFPNASCCVPAYSDKAATEYMQSDLWPVMQRTEPRGIRRLERWLSLARLLPKRQLQPSGIRLKPVVNIYRCSDSVVDVSGFTGSDEFGPVPAQQRFEAYELAAAVGNKIVLMPQSWGPLENAAVRRYVGRLVGLSDLVFAREVESLQYLRDLPQYDENKVALAPDIAFAFRAAPRAEAVELLAELGHGHGSRPLIGISPNMRIVERTPGNGPANDYYRSLLEVARELLASTDATLVLIPHEDTPGRANDPELCMMMAADLQAGGRVILAPRRDTAARVKALIGCLDLLVASRYHSLVAAMSMRVPVAVIGWSHKYDELMQAAGLHSWVVDPARRPGASAVDVAMRAWGLRQEIREALEVSVPQLEDGARRALGRMCDVIGS